MKLGAKLVAGFLIIALVLIAIGGLAFILQQKVNDIKQNVDDVRAEQDSMLEFGFSQYDEHAMAVRCFTTYNPVDVDNYIALKESMHTDNSIASNAILSGLQENATDCEDHQEMADDFTVIISTLEEAHDCFEENATLYANYQLSQADVSEVLGFLSEKNDEVMSDPAFGISNIVNAMDMKILDLESEEEQASNTLNLSIQLGMVAAVLLAILIGLALSRTMTSRLGNMMDAARNIKGGNLNVSVDEAGSDEISELAKAFNQMIMSVRLVAGDMGMMEEDEEKKE